MSELLFCFPGCIFLKWHWICRTLWSCILSICKAANIGHCVCLSVCELTMWIRRSFFMLTWIIFFPYRAGDKWTHCVYLLLKTGCHAKSKHSLETEICSIWTGQSGSLTHLKVMVKISAASQYFIYFFIFLVFRELSGRCRRSVKTLQRSWTVTCWIVLSTSWSPNSCNFSSTAVLKSGITILVF